MDKNFHIDNGKHLNKSLCKFLGCAFVLACLNPWTSFGTNSMDSQPWALISGIAFIFFTRHIRTPPYFIIPIISIPLGLIFSLMLSERLEAEDVVRFIASYATLLIVYIGFYNFLFTYGFPRKIFILSGWSWILFALIEIVAPSITAALSPQRTSEGRGLTSLAPEPTFFAIFLIFFSWILYRGSSTRLNTSNKVIISVSLLSVLVLARSAMGVLYLFSGIIVFFTITFLKTIFNGLIKKKHIVISASTAIIIILSFNGIKSTIPESRVGRILTDIIEAGPKGITTIIRMDGSIFTRVGHAVTSVHSAISNLGLPGGINTFSTKSQDVVDFWDELLWDFIPGDKIQSWNGAILYELGIFGLISYAALIFAARREGGASSAEIAIVIIFLVGAIPIAFPLAPMLFALWAYLGQTYRKVTND